MKEQLGYLFSILEMVGIITFVIFIIFVFK